MPPVGKILILQRIFRAGGSPARDLQPMSPGPAARPMSREARGQSLTPAERPCPGPRDTVRHVRIKETRTGFGRHDNVAARVGKPRNDKSLRSDHEAVAAAPEDPAARAGCQAHKPPRNPKTLASKTLQDRREGTAAKVAKPVPAARPGTGVRDIREKGTQEFP
jgi:hypothetical protein